MIYQKVIYGTNIWTGIIETMKIIISIIKIFI